MLSLVTREQHAAEVQNLEGMMAATQQMLGQHIAKYKDQVRVSATSSCRKLNKIAHDWVRSWKSSNSWDHPSQIFGILCGIFQSGMGFQTHIILPSWRKPWRA